MNKPENIVEEASRYSRNNRLLLRSNTQCVCYYCKQEFLESEITRWIERGQTALCPQCGIDSVLPKDFVESDQVLDELCQHWF